jgi:hypothetical protein
LRLLPRCGVSARLFVRNQRAAAAGAGFGGSVLAAGNKLFDAIITKPSGVIYAVSEYADSWRAVRLPDHKINLCIDEMLTSWKRWATASCRKRRRVPLCPVCWRAPK